MDVELLSYDIDSTNKEFSLHLRDATPDDALAIAAIYNHYIATTTISFEEDPVAASEMAARISAVQEGGLPWLIATVDGKLAGYAYASQWRVRAAYRYSVESTVYLAPEYAGRGLGAALYTRLLDRLREAGMKLVIGGIALPNASSISLHEKMGFSKAAHFNAVGRKFERWIDVGYWQLTL